MMKINGKKYSRYELTEMLINHRLYLNNGKGEVPIEDDVYSLSDEDLVAEINKMLQGENTGYLGEEITIPSWTDKEPTEPGYYWREQFGQYEIVRIVYSEFHNELWMERMGTGMHQSLPKYLAYKFPVRWYGPLQKPTEIEEK